MSENLNTTGELVAVEFSGHSVGAEISNITTGDTSFYSSIKGNDMDTNLAVLEAMSNAVSLRDHLKEPINLVNILIQEVQLTDDKTGEIQLAPRTTLIAEDGTAYSATSVGIFQSMRQLLKLAGEPSTWPKPYPIYAVEEGVAPRRYTTIKYGVPKSGK